MKWDKRSYKFKNPSLEFLCPLCGSERAFKYNSKLQKSHFIQMAIISVVIIMALFSFMGERSFIVPFIVWITFETIYKSLHRKEIPCPHCGFDATWYKRDVKMARKLVEDFWGDQGAQVEELAPEVATGTPAPDQMEKIDQITP